jgi:DNA-binding transcriptional LysR family regulator
MRDQTLFDKIDLHLIRVLHTVLTERSVSKAAIRLGMHQPAVSASLKKLRELAGDPLLVRSGAGMVPTDAGCACSSPAQAFCVPPSRCFPTRAGSSPQRAPPDLRIAASDYLDPLFLAAAGGADQAAGAPLPDRDPPLSAESDYRARLAQGDMDVVIGNWLKPPDDLHLGRLFGDEVVCLVAATTRRAPCAGAGTAASWLAAEHIAPTPTHPGARGVIDEHLDSLGLQRNITARCAHFGLIPSMVASTLLVLTTGASTASATWTSCR